MKKCTKCGIEKELSEFYKHTQTKSGVHPSCKECMVRYTKEHHKTKDGLIAKIHSMQLRHSRLRGHKEPSYTFNEFKEWVLSQDVFHTLYSIWVESGYKRLLIPSCDRIESIKPYSFDNIQIVTALENFNNSYNEQKNGVFGNTTPVKQIDLNGNLIGLYKSIADASRRTGTPTSHISQIVNNKFYGGKRRITANGFVWERWENAQW